jgi:hypothetical protein
MVSENRIKFQTLILSVAWSVCIQNVIHVAIIYGAQFKHSIHPKMWYHTKFLLCIEQNYFQLAKCEHMLSERWD